ncbi:MAG: type II toxin-antitoxin system RelE/ParE family toxin [Candidatus Aminicenantes bacterium]|nr:type II toxin-antitoxin system RelE/ParE family toxin [Candidatus Aminicenantes bacterium]
MNDYRIFETEQFQDDLRSSLGPRREKIVAKLHNDVYPQLRRQPYFGRNIKKLKGYRPETWRYRVGMYRFFYEIDAVRKIVFMLAADTRQSGY